MRPCLILQVLVRRWSLLDPKLHVIVVNNDGGVAKRELSETNGDEESPTRGNKITVHVYAACRFFFFKIKNRERKIVPRGSARDIRYVSHYHTPPARRRLRCSFVSVWGRSK